MLSLSENPPVKPAAVSALGEVAGDWFVAHTKARNEKKFAHELGRRGVAYFLPMVEKVTFSGGRKRRNMAPLFPGYVFFAGDGDTRADALATHRLCQVLPVRDRSGFVGEISQVDTVLTVGGDVEFFPHAALGKRVRVSGGHYENVEGIVVEHQPIGEHGEILVVLSISVLGTGAAIKVAPSLLVPADEPAPNDSSKAKVPSFVRVQPPERQLRGRPLPPELRPGIAEVGRDQ